MNFENIRNIKYIKNSVCLDVCASSREVLVERYEIIKTSGTSTEQKKKRKKQEKEASKSRYDDMMMMMFNRHQQ